MFAPTFQLETAIPTAVRDHMLSHGCAPVLQSSSSELGQIRDCISDCDRSHRQ